VGRPRKDIDPEQVIRLAKIGCTQEEIGDILGVNHRTIGRRFARELACARASGKMSLRRAQFIAAVKKYQPQMLMHLGKHWLGQTDKDERTDVNALFDDALTEPKPKASPGDGSLSG
jgi:hypothetical protein